MASIDPCGKRETSNVADEKKEWTKDVLPSPKTAGQCMAQFRGYSRLSHRNDECPYQQKNGGAASSLPDGGALRQKLMNFELTTTLSDEAVTTWARASRLTPLPDPLCSEPEWAMSFHETECGTSPILAFHEHGNVLILTEERTGTRSYLIPLESSWLYTRPLLGQDPLPLFFRALDTLEKHYSGKSFPVIVFGGMWPHTPMSNELLLNFGHVFLFSRISQGMQCSASLEDGIDGFLSRRSANFRSKLKKAVRRAKERGILYERVIPETLSDVHSCFERMVNIERKSWKGQLQDGLLNSFSIVFYKNLLTRLSRNKKPRLVFARHEGEDIGFIFGSVSRGIYRGQQFSYDLAWKDSSIGNTLQYEQLLWLCEEKILRYDMGPITGPRMQYKAHWTELFFPIEAWALEHQ